MTSKVLIHIVGGGAGQLPLLLKAKENGLSVLVTDMYPDSPCREYADYYCVVNTTDKEGTLEVARRYSIDAVVTDQTDVAVPTVAYVAEQLGLPGIGLEVANRFTNKLLMRQSCEVLVPGSMPSFEYFTDKSKAIEYIAVCDTPFIVKPISSQGSKGVFKCDMPDNEKVDAAFEESRGMGILVEQFIPGMEVALECFTVAGETQVLAFSSKSHFEKNDCIDRTVSFFDDLDPDVKARVEALNSMVVSQLGLKNGISHAEYKIHNGKPYLIEIAARGAGSGVSGKIIPQITGFDVNQFILDCALKKDICLYQKTEQQKYALLEFLDFAPGKVKGITINDEAMLDAEMFSMDLRPGDVIPDVTDSRDRRASFIVIDTSIEKVKQKAEKLRRAIDLTYD